MNTWLIADTHFNCPRLVANNRPWVPVDEHDKYILDGINMLVGRRDRLIIVGDFCFGKPYKWRSQIRCRDIWLVMGNHDKRSWSEKCFGKDRVRESMLIKHGEDRVFAAHFPHIEWEKSHYGSYHAYGHVHGERELEYDCLMPQRRSMDVSVDNLVKRLQSPCPILVPELINWLSHRTGYQFIPPEKRWTQRDYE